MRKAGGDGRGTDGRGAEAGGAVAPVAVARGRRTEGSVKRLMTLTDAAAYLCVDRATFRAWHRTGELPADAAVRMGRTTWFRGAALRRIAGE